VVTAVVSVPAVPEELEKFWSNVYLRGRMLYDPTAFVNDAYQQPPAGIPPLPASRGFLIGADQRIILANFGHDPQLFIDAIYEHLPVMGDVTGDGVVNVLDLVAVVAAWGSCADACVADLNGDSTVDVADLLIVILGWSG
jgi:hypothetical protein